MENNSGYQKALNVFRNKNDNKPQELSGYEKALQVLNKGNNESTPLLNQQNSDSTQQNQPELLQQMGSEAKGVALNFIKDFLKGGGSLVDLATEVTQGGAPDDAMSFAPGGSVDAATGKKDIFSKRAELEETIQQHNRQNPKFNFGIEEGLGKVVDKIAGEEVTPKTAAQRISGNAGRLASGALLGGPAGFVRNAALGAGIGAGSGILQEGNVPPIAADLASMAAALTGAGAHKLAKIFKNSSSISDAEKRVVSYLQGTLGEDGAAKAAENIAKSPKYPITGYEPTTAEVAEAPTISQLHRLRQGIPGTGLAERAGSQNKAITESATKLSLDKATSEEIKDVIGSELATRKATRRAETKPLYEELKNEKTQIKPDNMKIFFEENKVVKGKKKADLKYIKDLIKPSKTLTDKEKSAIKIYKEQRADILNQGYSPEATKKALSQLEKPQSNHPTVADLDEARQNINDKIKELKKSGQDNRIQLYEKAKSALDKDLEIFPKQAEITAKYAELSQPVNEIAKHPTLKKLPESRVNDILSKLYNDSSLDNVTSLKQVLKDNPEKWKGFQDASVEHMMKSIKNAGAEGSGNTLSYHKLNKFLEKHEKALKVAFSKDQMNFLEELKNAIKGRNIAETLGIEKQSATYGKLITGTHLGEGMTAKIGKGLDRLHAAPIPKLAKSTVGGLRMMLNGYLKSREGEVMSIVDKVLKDPEYAHKLMTHKFKNQHDFDKEMSALVAKKLSTIGATNKE
jgi:hypothetical protein